MLRLAWSLAKRAWPEVRQLPLRAAVALGSAGSGAPPRPDRLWTACALILPVALLAACLMPRIILVMSPSIDAWAVRAAPGPIAKGDFVMFELSHPLAGPTPVNVTKHALCMPGEMLTEIEKPSANLPGAWDGYYYCGTVLLGVSKAVGRNGQRLEHLAWGKKPVPPGFVYVGSSNPNSFDSRYYGPVAIVRLTRMEKLL
jgi:conjugal transfer pilin signal peptidase TrbI